MDFSHHTNPTSSTFAIRSTNVFLPDSFEPVEAIILIQDEKISDVVVVRDTHPDQLKSITDTHTIENYGNLCIFPGIIDSNVHLHTNYDKDWDNVLTSTKLAAAGGITTIVDNPIMTKTFETPEDYITVLKERIETLKASSNVDFGIFGVLEPKTEDVIQDMQDLGVLGLKCYLFNCLQSEIGYVCPEFLEGLLKNLSQHFPDLLLIFHPELATERELYLSSPCRLTSLENRLDMNFEIKSLALGGGANKGAYLEELEKSEFSDDLEDDDCPTPSLDTPSKLRSKIKKAKEKTEINQLVHFELMSYGYEENKGEQDAYSSDSDLEILDKSSQSPGLRVSRVSSNEKPSEKGFSLELNPVPVSAKPVRKSLFKKDEIKEAPSEDYESTPKSTAKTGVSHIVPKKSHFSSVKEDPFIDLEEQESPLKSTSRSPLKSSSKLFYDDKSPTTGQKSPGFMAQDRTPREKESTPHTKKNRSSSLVITFHSRVSRLLENQKQQDLMQSTDYLDTATTKSPLHAYEKDQEYTDDSNNKLSGSMRNILGSGLSKEESSGSELIDPMKKLNLGSDQDKTETSKSGNNQYGFSPDSNATPQEVKTSSLSSSPCFSNDPIVPGNSSLLERRTRGTSLTIPISRRPASVTVAPNNSLKIANADGNRSPMMKGEAHEQKYNTSYRIFLANRPQSWEENGVSWILSKFKPEMKLRILLQNLSLASSFLKIREKKKKDEQFAKTLYGDTSTAYMFFNERAVKKGETKYKATPPFRDKENRKWLIENFKLDGIDMITSYHLFVPQQYKDIDQGNFRRAFSGFESVGLNLQSVWTTMYAFYKKNNKRFNQEPFYQKKLINDMLCKICKALCSNPAEFLKIDHKKGKIEKGKDADFVVWDPYKLINNQSLPSNHIFSKRILYGVVNKTYIRGKLVYDKEGEVVNNFTAKFVTMTSS